jgi:hypothetical protein
MAGDDGLTDPGVLESDHPYCLALEAGCFADPSQPKDETDYTAAGVSAAAKEAA